MLGSFAAERDSRKARFRQFVIVPDIERIFAGVEATGTSNNIAIMFIGLADFKLITPTFQVFVEALEGGYCFLCHGSLIVV